MTRDRIRALQRALAPGRRSDKAPVPVPSQHVFALAEAIDQQRRIEISYRSPGEFPLGNASSADGPASARPAITLRQVDPYGLARVGPWYLVAYCHLRADLRTFRVARIRNVAPTRESFVRPVDFDAYRHVTESIAMAPGQGAFICRALLDTDMETASRLTPLATVVLEPVDSGVRLSVKLDADEMFWFASLLLRLPCPVRIEGPVELVAAAAKLAERATSLVSSSVGSAA